MVHQKQRIRVATGNTVPRRADSAAEPNVQRYDEATNENESAG